jgi:hypothetical protein
MKNNILIAEFMGYEIFYRPISSGFIEISDTELCDVDDLEFYSSWDWLMPVVQKIESLSKEEKVINWSRQNKNIFDFKLTECKIKSVFIACIEFIEWYNKNKK